MIVFVIYLHVAVGISDAVIRNQNGVKQFGICPPEDTKIQTLLKLSLNDCIQECVIRPVCKWIGYRHLPKICQLHTQSTSNGIPEGNCVQVHVETVLTTETQNGCIGQCNDGEVCETSTGQCVYKECKPFHQERPITGVNGNMNEVGSIKRVHVDSSITEETVCLLNGLWSRTGQQVIINVALNKPAEQSSVFGERFASIGVDGNKLTTYSYCFHTLRDVYPWWMVDLELACLVYKYVLYNRNDPCCNVRARAHDIVVRFAHSTDAWTQVDFIPGVMSDIHTKTFTPAMSTRYVHISIKSSDLVYGDYLHLCEVEVYGLRNVALNKPTEQSSYHLPALLFSALGVDGGICQNFILPTLLDHFHTQPESNPWWLVDLQDYFYITGIVLYNRLDFNMNVRAHDIAVHFGYSRSTLFLVDFVSGMLPNIYTRDFTLDILTRLAKISIVSMNGQLDILHLCEVELFGYPGRQE
ncbi:hypothetical protein ACF0H5_009550 [Mactra antiquata]